MITKIIEIKATPIGAPRMTRSDRWKKRACVTDYHIYRDLINKAMRLAGVNPDDLHNCHRIDWYAQIPLKKSYSKKKQAELVGKLITEKPDKDNIEKGLLDSLFRDSKYDDKVVGCGWTQKTWCPADSVGKLTAILHFGDLEEFLLTPSPCEQNA